ncbi:MAG: U32 family peptidase [Planctomycetes bacterium]|nr:U32 family peptidase [Planctomycetota bacterium]
MKRPEILAPAGDRECLPAAVAAGADAVYLGLRHFNARGRAENFRRRELPGLVAWLHRQGLRCYLVLNTLVHDDEFAKALDLAWHAQLAGVDAVIVQDLGLWRLLRQQLPELALHASTQMTVHDPSQIAVLARLGARRIILARELTLPEIRACAAAARAHGVEVECFVHGALCYAYSGQCLISNFAGCRSANRGTCAQNCRFVYERGDGAPPDTVLSLRDLALLPRLGELIEAGVASFKIEGRLKGPDYVYAVTSAYRAARDAWLAGRPPPAALGEQLRAVFARPFTAGPLEGDFGEGMRVHRAAPENDRAPDARLLALDRRRQTALIDSASAPRAGLGYQFHVGMWQDGFLVLAAAPAEGGRWRLRVRVARRGPRAPSGTPLFINRDQAVWRALAAARAALPPLPRRPCLPLAVRMRAVPGSPLMLEAACRDGRRAAVSGPLVSAARGRPLCSEEVRRALGTLQDAGYLLEDLACELAPAAFVPVAELTRARRALLAALAAQPAPPPPAPPPPPAALRRRRTRLWVAVGSLDAAAAARQAGADEVVLDDPTLDLWQRVAGPPPEGLWLRAPATAPPPSCAAPLFAGHLGALAAARARGQPAIADASLNVTNRQTLVELAELGAAGAVLSLELSGRELARLAGRVGDLPLALLVVAHGRVPAMLTRQDHGLAPGAALALRASAAEGGLPYQLQRRARDTVLWEGRRLCAPEAVAASEGLVDGWLLELADLAPPAVAELTAAYAALRAGTLSPAALRASAARHAPFGLFSGHWLKGARALDAVAAEAAEA